MKFYELYIKDTDGYFKEIPISVAQYIDSDGNLPNSNDNNKYVKRFYIIDNQIGLESGYKYPTAIRYASSIKFTISMDSSDKQKIFIPNVRIEYKEKLVNPSTGSLYSPMATITFKT